MGGCPLGDKKVQLAAPEVRADSWCLSQDSQGGIHLCFFQDVPGKRVCVIRALLEREDAEKLSKALDGLMKKAPRKGKSKNVSDDDELRYIA
ncbi:MAG: hypothetical protein QGG50_05570 [Methanopyri archaeon]|jgi:hypothetical protein|nr:hypothetical protein [Methanopyri archaeon]|tara:strand:+ start:216 stop:491 length:276 start_codon:yes stop_codon:yes gene_type:complete